VKLYFFPIAPNPTKVCLHLAEKAAAGATIDIEYVSVDLTRGEQRSPQHAARNPLERLPVLELDDGTFLCESLAIIEYLEELHPQPSLWGDTPLERARARDLERLADSGVLLSIGRLVHATRSPLGLPPSPEIAAAARTSLEKALAVLETRFADGRPFVAGSRVTVADCTLAAALQFGRFAGIDAVADCPNVARWDAAYRARPAAGRVLRA
jgi:glutathione S-transferase